MFATALRTAFNRSIPSIVVKHTTPLHRSLYLSSANQQNAGTPAASSDLFYIDQQKGYVTMRFNKTPVNSLSLEFLTALNIQLEKLEQSKDINGVILTSVRELESYSVMF